MKKEKSWWLVLVQGIIAIGLGVYILVQSEQAIVYIGMLGAAYIFISGITQTVGTVVQKNEKSKSGLIRGIAGMVIGGGLLAAGWFGWIDVRTGYTLLAIGLLIYGGLGLWRNFFDRGDNPFSWGPIFLNALLMLWGFLVFFSRMQGFDLAFISAVILIVFGAVAIVWSFLIRPNSGQEASESGNA